MSDAWARARAALHGDWTVAEGRDRDATLAERARRLALPERDAASLQEGSVLRVRLGGAVVELPAASVRDVGPATPPHPIPGAPDTLLGLARVRGALVAVFDAGPVVTGRATPYVDGARLLTVDAPDQLDLVLLAESVEGPVPAQEPDGSPSPRDASPCVRAIAPDGALILRLDALLSDPRLMVDQS